MAVVAGQDHHPPRVTGQLQQRAERADPIDRPVVPNLLRPAQAVVDGVDDDADDPVVRGQDRLAQVITDDPSGTLR